MPTYNYNAIKTLVASRIPSHRQFIFLPWALALLLIGATGSSFAEDSPDDFARQTKATHLINFAHYIEWPHTAFENSENPVVIGVIGAASLAEELARISPAHDIGKRTIVIKRLTTGDESAKVHILYIGRRAEAALQEWLATIEAQPMLTVCDATHELAHTCAVKFLFDDDRLRFDISLPAAERSGIKITAPLLTVARQVDE